MIFHLSIGADDPQRTAEVLAEIWDGKAMPFPPVGVGSWMAFSGADDGTMVEVYPRGTAMHHGEVEATGVEGAKRRENATHFAMSTKLSIEQVYAIAGREGWPVRYCRRADMFGVIEVWIDGCNLVEVLTPEMQREYLDSVTVAGWQALLAAGAPEQKLAA
jgi:hypothetical protein